MKSGVEFMMGRKSSVAIFFVLALITAASAQVKLPKVLASHMVVQRDLPVHVWGMASAGELVSVSFRGETGSTTASQLGRWSVYLKPGAAGATAGREDHSGRTGGACTLEDPQCAQKIHVGIEDRVGDGHPDVGLGGEVEDDLGTAARHEVHHFGRSDVEPVEGQLIVGGDSSGGQVGERARREVVDHIDRVTLGQEAVDERRTDEAGASRDEDPHGQLPDG